ncbi:hypothetical protein NC653_010951 [Populus alba x Populus x berolinensis]|uniref:G-patch domain-containing protein n=1 Tax=Populus alba x Populus x berolinensis TaxID=444605 RepID=A0AAD6W6Z6_9ROSI|nr:hypothetical protein NC653_010951 [Populus alba x Populus x berolinensis]
MAGSSTILIHFPAATPFRTDASALGSYTPPVAAVSGKRRFSEMPLPSASTHKEQPQTSYRDRAAERRSLYGSSSVGDDLPDMDSRHMILGTLYLIGVCIQKECFGFNAISPWCWGGRGIGDAQSYEVITADKALGESNVGNRMLRNMGLARGLGCKSLVAADNDAGHPCEIWVLGLGKDGSGMIEPVQAQAIDRRAGLGSQQKKLDPSLEVQAGDSYKTLIQKKALARFREMSILSQLLRFLFFPDDKRLQSCLQPKVPPISNTNMAIVMTKRKRKIERDE